jgi:hypothetical protein
MNLYERNTCTFIVKVWVEGSEGDAGVVLWRGHITNVFSGRRRYFENLTTVDDFIIDYLREMGIEVEKAKNSEANRDSREGH